MRNNNNMSVPVSETYWSLVAKADKKFSKIRDLPYYERNRYDTYFSKVFKAYTQLWKFQQENRQKLVEAGLKRWEIGDIASRIGQLYFGQYMRTSDRSYLSESYIFYEAVLTREYFRDGFSQDLNLAIKQLRFLARFLTVCLVMSRREMVFQLVNQLKMLLDECKRTFQETDFREWKLVVQEIGKFLKADTGFMNSRPLRYSLVLDLHPDYIPHVADAKRKLKLGEAILCSYHPNEIKFSELTLDTFRMLQCLEWEPSGSFYQSTGAASGIVHKGASGPSRINYTQDIADPTLPVNPRKAMLYRPSATHFIAVLATLCEELPPDGVLLVYISASGSIGHNAENIMLNLECSSMQPEATSTPTGGLHIGARGDVGLNCIYPCDFIPFTRRPLFLIIDSSMSESFKAITGKEKGERIAMLLSPSSPSPTPGLDSISQPSGSIFTSFLTAPLQAFLLLIGFSGSDVEMDLYDKADKLLSSLLDHWGSVLISSDGLDLVWVQVLGDPFLRRLLLRFIFCETVLTLHGTTSNKKEYLPQCLPCLPKAVSPATAASQTALLQIASIFGASNRFIFSEAISIYGDAQTTLDKPIST